MTKKQLQTVKCFVKDETYGEFKFPRGIYSRTDHAKCLFGPLVQSVSNQLFKLNWFIKKVPVVDRPKVIYDTLYEPGAKYVFTDYTSFEAHFHALLMDACENELFKFMTKLLPDARAVADLMASTKTGCNHLVFKTFSALLKACRMSGEMDTSTSNGFTNLMLYLFTSQEAGCPVDKVKGFVEGDDGIFKNKGPNPTTEDFEKLGMTIKIGVTDRLETASFCGQVYDIDDKTVVTDIQDQVCRLGWTNKKYVNANQKTAKELLRARGYSLVYQFGKCPILGVLGKKILELTDDVVVGQKMIDNMDAWDKEKYLESLKWGSQVAEPGMSTRQLVDTMYNISVSEQYDIENKIRSMKQLGPLPFQFSSVDTRWTDFYDAYNASHMDEVPFWIRSDERVILDTINNTGCLKLPVYNKLSAGLSLCVS